MAEHKVMKNKPVGYHEVDYLLSCNHINAEKIEAVIFIPKEGEERVCLICHKPGIITKMGSAYWVDQEDTD